VSIPFGFRRRFVYSCPVPRCTWSTTSDERVVFLTSTTEELAEVLAGRVGDAKRLEDEIRSHVEGHGVAELVTEIVALDADATKLRRRIEAFELGRAAREESKSRPSVFIERVDVLAPVPPRYRWRVSGVAGSVLGESMPFSGSNLGVGFGGDGFDGRESAIAAVRRWLEVEGVVVGNWYETGSVSGSWKPIPPADREKPK
jgi:hypothetical protein